MEVKRRVLMLEDRPQRHERAMKHYEDDTLVIVEDVETCIELINNETWDIISLDHDLNMETNVYSGRLDCGMEAVRWLERNATKFNARDFPFPKKIIIHSSNKVASEEMLRRLNYVFKYGIAVLEELPRLCVCNEECEKCEC